MKYRYDPLIVKIAYENQSEGIGYRELQRKTGLVNRTFDRYMHRLRITDVLTKKKAPSGIKDSIRLTERVYQDCRTGILHLPSDFLETKRKEIKFDHERQTFKLRPLTRLYLAIIILATYGSSKEVPVSNRLEGNVERDGPLDGFFYPSPIIPGVSVGDIVFRIIKPGKNARMLTQMRGMLMNEIFADIKLPRFPTKDVRSAIKSLQDHDPPILKKMGYPFKDRFEVCDPLLLKFIKDWIVCLFSVERRMQWCYKISNELEANEERQYKHWLTNVYGVHAKLREMVSSLESKNEYASFGVTELQKNIDIEDRDIQYYRNIFFTKYRDILECYPIISIPMLWLAYPPFLQCIYEKKKRASTI